MSAMIPQQGFVPDQVIDVRIQLDNRSIVHVKHVKVSLKKIMKFASEATQRAAESTEAVAYCDSVPAREKKLFVKHLKVPNVPPTIEDSEFFQVLYVLQIKAKTVGATKSPVLRLPIFIGTVPLFENDRRDYELELMEPRILEFAPMSYEQCMASCPVTPGGSDLIDFSESVLGGFCGNADCDFF